MESIVMALPSASPQKRSFQDMVESEPSPLDPHTVQRSIESTMPSRSTPVPKPSPKQESGQQEQRDQRQASRETSTLTSISATPPPPQLDGTTTSTSAPQPAKRRKLTPAEKQVREQEKAEKRTKREEENARKAEEKQRKDEERRQKNEEREEKKRERELEKQRKEEKKKQEDEEKLKRERVSLHRFATFMLLLTVFQAQMRMTSFFAKPGSSPKVGDAIGDATLNNGSSAVPRREETETKDETPESNQSTPTKKRTADYKKTFLPFALPKNAVLAPTNRFTWDAEATEYSRKKADSWFAQGATEKDDQADDRNLALHKSLDLSPLELAPRGFSHITTKELLERASGTRNNPVDVTGSDQLHMLREIPMKYIHFHEDVRPPYVGSFSGAKSKKEMRKLARNPHGRVREELEYDEDSEAEWEEPEEGEDIDSEGESDADSADGADELDDFLDDAEDGQMPRKKAMVGDMKPVSSGLCWADEKGHTGSTDDPVGMDLRDLRLEIISEDVKLPIDPFSTALWSWRDSRAPETNASGFNSTRPPLQAKPNIELNRPDTLKVPDAMTKANVKTNNKPLRLLSGSELEDFKRIVDGSDMTKQGVLAIAKKRLPKATIASLSDTLGHVARRVGSKESDKKWVLNTESTGG
ncbi:MAG: chromatin assembly factor-I (CAF-I) p90 subunit [Alyxoria varia]|nr:MAG: chromatin assembly factor-I (CAF-I) p90 subunit [Alyxoria varia]